MRPDKDPAGFQKLVEARGYAVELARSRAADALEDEDDDTEDRLPETAAIEPLPDPGPLAVAPTTLPVVVEPVHVELAPTIAPPPVTIELRDPMPAPAVAPATGEPEPLVAPSARIEAETVPLEAILLEPDAVLARLRNLLSAMGPKPAPGEAARVLADLERLPRSIRQMIEPEILRTIARALPAPVKETFPRLSALLRRLGLIADPLDEQRAQSQMRRALLVALDENFGWTTSDRRVHQALPQTQAVQLMAYLHASHQEQRIAREGLPVRWDGDGLPILDPTDLQAFFGSELPHYGVAYQEAKLARAWAPDWRPWLVLFAPIWMLPLRQYRLMGAWLAALLVTGILLADHEKHLVPFLQRQFPANHAALSTLANLLAFTPVAALHLYVARNSGRLEVERLARLAAKADRKGLFEPRQRAAFFRKRAPGFRFETASKNSGWVWNNWWWIVIGIAVVRLIGIMSK